MQLRHSKKPSSIASLTLIVSVYKEVDLLEFFFHTLSFQAVLPAQIIVSEDGDSHFVADKVNEIRSRYPSFQAIDHLQQPDQGFRKTTAMNAAICSARYEQIVFMDVDCFPHRNFFKEASILFRMDSFLIGRPALLKKEHYKRLLDTGRTTVSILDLIRSKARPLESGIYLPWRKPRVAPNRHVLGSGWSCSRSNLIAVNGFDEKFNEGGYGFEDTDIGNRLMRAGVIPLLVKNRLVYFHNGQGGEVTSEMKVQGVEKNLEILEENNRQKRIKASFGISDHRDELV